MQARRLPRRALYLETIDLIREDIRSGKYPQGSKLPSEGSLAQEFAVSRVTLREALRILQEEGAISRHPGKGTFVREYRTLPVQNLSAMLSLSTVVGSAGLEDQFSRTVARRSRAQGRLAKQLQIEPNEEVLEIERLRIIHGKPAVYSVDTLPARLLPQGAEKRLPEYWGSLYRFLCEVCGEKVMEGICLLNPIVCDEALAEVFETPLSTPLMFIEMLDSNKKKTPILYAQEYYLPKFFKFQVVRRNYDSEKNFLGR